MCNHSHFVKGIIIAVWTIVQTSFHIIIVIGEHYVCQFKPSHYVMVIFYITYFYNYDTCGEIQLGGEHFFTVKKDRDETRLIYLGANSSDKEGSLYEIVHSIVEQASWPRESNYYGRARLYLFLYVICDGCWLLCAFLLFAGICFQVKKCLSLIFYGPWLLVTAVSVILDVVSAVHFGLDLLHVYNYTSWLKFIGVRNYEDFTEFNKYKSSSYVPHFSTIAMSVFFSRFFIFWVINITNFFSIATSLGIAYRGDSISKRNHQLARRSSSRAVPRTMDTSESRIRKWQIFYGTVNTMSSRSSISNTSNSHGKMNLSRNNSEENMRKVAGNSTTRYSLDSNIDFVSPSNSSSMVNSNYLKFQDVTEGVDTNKVYRRNSDELKSQIPWSYLRFETPPRILIENSEARSRPAGLQANQRQSTAF